MTVAAAAVHPPQTDQPSRAFFSKLFPSLSPCPRPLLTWPAVRVGYPCFGNPRKNAQGKIVGYPAYGRWRVHNLFISIWQKVPQRGKVQPYDVYEVYRF